MVITLGHSLERRLGEALQQSEQGEYLSIDPSRAQKIMQRLAKQLEKFAASNLQPLVLCSAPIRLHFKRLVDRFIPNLTVLSYEEIEANVRIQSLGAVEMADED